MGIGETELPCPICKKNSLADMDGAYECHNCGACEIWKEEGTEKNPFTLIWTKIPLPIGLLQTSAYGRKTLEKQKEEGIKVYKKIEEEKNNGIQ